MSIGIEMHAYRLLDPSRQLHAELSSVDTSIDKGARYLAACWTLHSSVLWFYLTECIY